MDWKKYQEETAKFFRSLGLDAETDVTLKGVRTSHDVDVLAISHHAGFDITWIIECKLWNSKVSKLHVLALREIVSDTGADRGIILAENGFQSGAIEAAALTNVHVTTLAEITNSASTELLSMKLSEIYDRLICCKSKYWEIPKALRVESGLRPDVPDIGYSGEWVIKIAEDLITKAYRGTYPIVPDEMHRQVARTLIGQSLPPQIISVNELVCFLEPLIEGLEKKIIYCKNGLQIKD